MNFKSLDDIKVNGFLGFKKMSEVFNDKSPISKVKGVYLILDFDIATPQFSEVGCGPTLYKKKTNPNVSIEELKSNWVNDTIVINILLLAGFQFAAIMIAFIANSCYGFYS